MKIRLHQTFGAHAGRVRELDQDVITFGRLPTCDVAFDPHADLDASGSHAEIRREGDAWVLRDVGSRNGTLVNGRPVQRHVLVDGDEIEFGTGGPRVKVELLRRAGAAGVGTLAATPILAEGTPSASLPGAAEKKYGQQTLDAAVRAAAAKARAEALGAAETHRAPLQGTALLADDQLPRPGMLAPPTPPLASPAPAPGHVLGATPPAVVTPVQSDRSWWWTVAALVGLFVLLSLCLLSCVAFGWLYARGVIS
ncbi:MAG: hypothetical protein OHK0013_02110 [Sandaracinaceae bacterium]